MLQKKKKKEALYGHGLRLRFKKKIEIKHRMSEVGGMWLLFSFIHLFIHFLSK
jgi:hypothetical protein